MIDLIEFSLALVEFSLARNTKASKKSFYRYTADKRKSKENIKSLKKEMGDLITWDTKKVEVLLNNFFALVFTDTSHATKSQKAKAGIWRIKNHLLWEKVIFKDV